MRLSLFFFFFPLLSFFLCVSSSPTEQTCSYCEGLSDSTCLIKLSGIISSLDQSDKYDLYIQMFPSGRCNGMTEAQCVSSIDELIQSLSDERKYKSFKTACTQDILTASDSDSNSCQLCYGMTTDYCLSTLTQLIGLMSDSERLNYEKQVFNSHCQGLEDEDCLSSLDYLMSQLSSSDFFNTIFQSCVTGQLNPSRIISLAPNSVSLSSSSPSSCSLCSSLSDNDCFNLLEEKMSSFNDEQKLAVLFDAFPEQQSSCLELTESQCLTKIEKIAKILPLQQRSSILKQSCDVISTIAGTNDIDSTNLIDAEPTTSKPQDFANKPPGQLEVDTDPEGSECKLCSGLSGAECHTVLSESMKSLDEQTRLELEQQLLHNSCEDMTGKDCLTMLDETLSSMEKTERFAVLKDACQKGLFPITSFKIESVLENNQPSTGLLKITGLIAFVAIGAVFYNRKKNLYSKIPESEVELEI